MDNGNNCLLRAQDLIINLGNTTKYCSFCIESNAIGWAVGPSGNGKTTLLRTLARLTIHVSGNMYLENQSWQEIPPQQWRTQILYVHQKPVMFKGTVLENLQAPFLLRNRVHQHLNVEKARNLSTRLLLPEDILDRPTLNLSGGEAARVSLVRSILVNPTVLLLDEITAALDPDTRETVLEILAEWISGGKRAIVATSHDEQVRQILRGKDIILQEL